LTVPPHECIGRTTTRIRRRSMNRASVKSVIRGGRPRGSRVRMPTAQGSAADRE
jgi:hypothetical protein